MHVNFTVGGVTYQCEPLNFHWQRKVQKDYISAIEALTTPSVMGVLDKIDGNDMAHGDATALLDAIEPLVLASLKIVAACEDQRVTLGNEERVKTGGESYEAAITFDQLERRLTPNEAMGLMIALPAWIVQQQPKPNQSGEATPAGDATHSPS